MDYCIEEKVYKCVAQELFNGLGWGLFSEDKVEQWVTHARDLLGYILLGRVAGYEQQFGSHDDVNLTSSDVIGVRVFATARNDVIYTGFLIYAPEVKWPRGQLNIYDVINETWDLFRARITQNAFTPMRRLFATNTESIGPKIERFEKNINDWAAGIIEPEDWNMSNVARWVESVSDEYVAYWHARIEADAKRREQVNGSPYMFHF